MVRSYNSCLPFAGTFVAVFCAGMRGANYQTRNPGEQRDYEDGRTIGASMPRRVAKKRASRILHEHRMDTRRWCSRGNVEALHAVPSDAGFTRFPTNPS